MAFETHPVATVSFLRTFTGQSKNMRERRLFGLPSLQLLIELLLDLQFLLLLKFLLYFFLFLQLHLLLKLLLFL